MGKRKMRKGVFAFAIFVLFLSFGCFGFAYYFNNNTLTVDEVSVNNIEYDDGVLRVSFKNTYGKFECGIRDIIHGDYLWKKISTTGMCKFDVGKTGRYDLYVRKDNVSKKLDSVNETFNVTGVKKKYYIATGDKTKFLYKALTVGDGNYSISSSNEKVAYVNDNTIIAKKSGTTEITIKSGSDEYKSVVRVTGLIDKMPKNYNYNRSFLSCNVFSEKESKLLEDILADRVKTAGYGTRAGVVAAARFLTLEFPYRIAYFSENGRLHESGVKYVDGEGRYYHKGLYLSESKFSSIEASDKGPAIWGCPLYSRPAKATRNNGLDCSGFTTWVVLNGGFDIGDLPANSGGDSSNDLNGVGEEVQLTYEVAMSDKIKAGDLLGEVTKSEGHSAIVVGVDDDNYYVAEALWISPLGVNINTYSKETFADNFETVNLMDSYYKKQGNYTDMWY